MATTHRQFDICHPNIREVMAYLSLALARGLRREDSRSQLPH
jgi:hypothetical protein